MSDNNTHLRKFNTSYGSKKVSQKEIQSLKKHCKQQLVNTEASKSEKQGKKRLISFSQETYSSPVCYANKKEEMRADFQDE